MLSVYLLAATNRKNTRTSEKIRALAEQQGRSANDIKVFVGITVVVADTHDLAVQKLNEYRQYASPEAGLAHYASSTGIDLSKFADDEAIPYQKVTALFRLPKNLKNSKSQK